MRVAPGSWLDLLLRAIARALLAGAALALAGLVVHGAAGALTPRVALGEVAFDLALGLFVVAPTAFVEGCALRRASPPFDGGCALLLTFVAAAGGAGAAFVQSLYSSAALRTGSLEAGLAEAARGASLFMTLVDLLGLFISIAVVISLVTLGRMMRWSVRGQALGATAVALTVVPVILLRSGLRGPPLAISEAMVLALALTLPPLAALTDRWADRLMDPDAVE